MDSQTLGGKDEQIEYQHNPDRRINRYYFSQARYARYVRLVTSILTTGMVFDEMEAYGICKYDTLIVH